MEIPIPSRIANLPVDPIRKIPIPWFVPMVDGKPEFRTGDYKKFKRAVNERLCWVCGERLGVHMTFVVGPMCGINRTGGDPPCHLDCAIYSVRACPFLARPAMERREAGLEKVIEENAGGHAGYMIMRNPGVSLLWNVRGYKLQGDGRGGVLFHLPDPESVTWWREGRPATRAEAIEAVASGFPILEELAAKQEGAMTELHRMAHAFERYYPAL
jgi:hypothetical protein